MTYQLAICLLLGIIVGWNVCSLWRQYKRQRELRDIEYKVTIEQWQKEDEALK